jgi:hypothetical protein
MTEDNTLDQPPETVEVVKPEPKKPSFRRVSAEKPAEVKQPSFKRVMPEDKPIEKQIIAPKPQAVIVQEPVQTDQQVDIGSIASLVEIRNHVNALVNGNFTLAKDKMKDLQKVSLLMDRKIVDMVLSSEFKSFVNFQDAGKAMQEAIKNNTITNHPLRNLYG